MTSCLIIPNLERLQHLLVLMVVLLVLFGSFWCGVICKPSPEKNSLLDETKAKVESCGPHRKLKADSSNIDILSCSWNCSVATKPVPMNATASPQMDCKANREFQIYTAQNNITVSHVPKFDVTVYSTCPDCTVRNVHIECGEFASAVLPDPCLFRRCAINDCLKKNGSPILPLEGLTFSYANTFAYPLKLKPVPDSDVSCTNVTAARASKTGDG